MTGLRALIARRRFTSRIRRAVQPGRFGAYGNGTVVHAPFAANRRERIEIGEASYVLAGAGINIDPAASDARVVIGARTYLGRDLTITCSVGVVIGDDVMGSDRVVLLDTEPVPGPDGATTFWCAPVKIGSGVFLGTGAVVLPGVSVGRNSLVAAGAVVSGDVPANAVVAGNPARVIRHHDPLRGWVDGPPVA